MTMNILLHELRAYRKSTIIWTLSLIAIAALFMSFFPSFTKDTEEFRKLLEGYPASLREAFGINLDNFFSIPVPRFIAWIAPQSVTKDSP